MSTPDRRLLAILAADVVGYSRLMEADEAGTLTRLKHFRAEVTDANFTKHHGRIIKIMGDGVLVGFDSVVDAVSCAVEIQRITAECNAALKAARSEVIDPKIVEHSGRVFVQPSLGATMLLLSQPQGWALHSCAIAPRKVLL